LNNAQSLPVNRVLIWAFQSHNTRIIKQRSSFNTKVIHDETLKAEETKASNIEKLSDAVQVD
jgi:hypothetical protein